MPLAVRVPQHAARPRRHPRHGDAGAPSPEVAGGRADSAAQNVAHSLPLLAWWPAIQVLADRRRARRRRRRRRGLLWLRPHHGVGRHGHDAALAGAARAAQELEEALLPPGGAPRVLQQPEGSAPLDAVADQEHGVAGLHPAALSEDAGAVEVEGPALGLDAHRHGLLRHGLHQRPLVVGAHVAVASDAAERDGHRAAAGPASALTGLVGVARRGAKAGPRCVSKRGLDVAAPASVAVAASAV
mmetsp:Transcript_71018/g.208142  ORF Transcript_71018/g.208142 Transcript_71018/m.208142 type:complete len:243 (-) Transcript_71018:581-1309(-)